MTPRPLQILQENRLLFDELKPMFLADRQDYLENPIEKTMLGPNPPVRYRPYAYSYRFFAGITEVLREERKKQGVSQEDYDQKWERVYQKENLTHEEFMAEGRAINAQDPNDEAHVGMFLHTALHQWSLCRGVYRFDPSVLQALTKTVAKGSVPAEVLTRLPEWCPYVETLHTHLKWGDVPMLGFFAWIEIADHDGEFEYYLPHLCFLMDFGEKGFLPFELVLGKTLDEVFEGRWARETLEVFHHAMQKEEPSPFDVEQVKGLAGPLVSGCLNLLLWLCSEKPDIHGKYGQPERPKRVKTKQGMKEFPVPQQVREWDVAYRYGSVIRLSEERQAQETQDSTPTGARVRPHTRVAHWHTYWTGSKKEGQVPVLRWIHPVLVNAGEVNAELPAVIHRVKE